MAERRRKALRVAIGAFVVLIGGLTLLWTAHSDETVVGHANVTDLRWLAGGFLAVAGLITGIVALMVSRAPED